MNITNPFTHYQVYYISGHSSATGNQQVAEIDCFLQRETPVGHEVVRKGIIYFLPDHVTLPSNINTINGIYLYYRSSRFNDVMTLLKEEKPLFLSLNTVSLVGHVGTGIEPVGEQEGYD
jgi:hypothetical protein